MGVDDQTEQIVRIIRTKYLSRLSQPEKIIAALSRRGFRYREIGERLNAFEDRGTVDPDNSINGEMQ
jgi:SOS response regulatory protein OraA/RecX